MESIKRITHSELAASIRNFLSSNTFLYLLGLCLALLSIYLWKTQQAKISSQLLLSSQSISRSYASETEIRYNHLYQSLERLASLGAPREVEEIEDWKKDAVFYITTFEGLKKVFWIDENLSIRSMAPLEDAANYVGKSSLQIFLAPSELNLWIACHNGVDFSGYIVGIIDVADFISPVIREIDDEYMLQIEREGATIYSSTNWENPKAEYTVSHLITLKDSAALTLSFAPTTQTTNSEMSHATNILLFSLFFTFLTLLAVYLAQNMNALALLSKLRYRNLFESSQDAIFLIDMQGKYKDANPAGIKMVGYSPSELREMQADDIQVQEEQPETEQVAQLWKEVGKQESWFKHKEGDLIPVDLMISPIEVGKEQKYTLVIARDITERKWAEAEIKAYSENLEEMVAARTHELKEAQEMLLRKERLAALGELSGSVAHELRNPLGVITNAVYYLKMSLSKSDEDFRKYLLLIESEAQNAARIITELLDFARLKRANQEKCRVSGLIEKTIERNQPPEKISVDWKVQDELPPVFGDCQQINQVLNNLISNAYQAMPEGGRLSITAARVKNEVQIAVSDTGCGIAPEHRKKIFEPLFTTKARGIGLGLAISQKLMQGNGGKIEFESQTGEGTTFRLRFPLNNIQT